MKKKTSILTPLWVSASLLAGMSIAPTIWQGTFSSPIPQVRAATAATSTVNMNSLKAQIAAWTVQLNTLKEQSNPDNETNEAINAYTSAIDFANKAVNQLATLTSVTAQTEALPAQTEQLERQITILTEQVENFNAQSLTKGLSAAQLQAQVQAITNNLAALDASASGFTYNQNANLDVINANSRLQEISTALSGTNTAAKTAALQAEAAYLNAQNALNNYYINKESTYHDYNNALGQVHDLQSRLYNLQLTAYSRAYTASLATEVDQQAASSSSPLIQQQAEINRQLVANLDKLTSQASRINDVAHLRKGQLDLATQVSNTIDSQIQLLKGTLELNILINQQKELLPNVDALENYSSQVLNLRVQNFQYIAELQELQNQNQFITKLQEQNNVTLTEQERATLVNLLAQRADLLDENIKQINQIIVDASNLDGVQAKLINTINEIDNKLNQQDFFVRSTPSVNTTWVKSFIYSTQNQAKAIFSQMTLHLGYWLYYLLGALSIIAGFAIRSQKNHLIATLELLRRRVNVHSEDSLLVTPAAVFLSLFTDIHRSFIWGGTALILFNTVFTDTTYLLDYFAYSFVFLMFYTYTMNLTREGGVINAHYSPQGSFYAKLDNKDSKILEEDTAPQPRVPYTPLCIFTSSQVAAVTEKNFYDRRQAYLDDYHRHNGYVTADYAPYAPTADHFDPVDQRVVHHLSATSISKDEYHQTAGKVLEQDKYIDLADAPVKQEFIKTASFTTAFRNVLKVTFFPIFLFVNIMYFNTHPAVTPSENIIGQTLYLVGISLTAIIMIKYTLRMVRNYRLTHPHLDFKFRLGLLLMWLIPIALFIMTANGYVNTTTIILKHLLYTYYGAIILVIVARILQREFAILSLQAARNTTPEQAVNNTEESQQSSFTQNTISQFLQEKEQQRALFRARRDTYMTNFPDFLRLSNVISWVIGIAIFYSVWSDLMSVITYLDNVTIWQVQGTVAGTVENITLLNALRSLIYLIITYFVWRNLKPLLDILIFSKLKFSEGLPYAIQTIATYIVIIVGFSTSFSTLGMSWSKLQWLISALLVGLGFGLQQIFSNFVSGIIILFERPIRIKDYITINGISGSIKSIKIRATTIVDADNKEVIIPNQNFVTGSFTNWTLSETRTRIVFTIGVAYGSDIDMVTETLMEAARSCPLVNVSDAPPSCYFYEFGASSLNYYLRFYVQSLGDRMPATHEVNRMINTLCNERGIDISFNQLDVFIKNGSGVEVKLESKDLMTLKNQ
ncbi:mechanosensitive ion channel domain-containing protein [Psittacicella hinzii]|uniref:Mechanosensitive channel MscK n=1 Tax=Psittacicella hinzii TaxID=2028575 RepID=A0A3A1YHL1_9GAMM|nr:mechanosensitive ion channel domain-containing protein [Psittacicella hinzii]RIY37091.1 hypothetical protein CKF58_05360 [Psittacicella hinzii]